MKGGKREREITSMRAMRHPSESIMPFSVSQKLSNMAALFQKIPPSKRTTNDHNTE